MKTLVVYRTRYGAAAECAAKIKEHLQGQTDIIDLKTKKKIDLDPYDTVVIGGSIYAGRIQHSLLRFCDKQKKRLAKKRIALYICCLYENEKAAQELGVPFLGKIPLDPKIVSLGDDGKAFIDSLPDSKAAKAFMEVVDNITKVNSQFS